MQLTHYNTKFKAKQFPIILVCDNVTNAPNIGGLFRIADAFGVEKLILCGEKINLGRKMSKTSRATENSVKYEILLSVTSLVKNFKSEGYKIYSLEITEESEPLHKCSFTNQKPIVLIVGDENFGVSEDLLAISDNTIHINMFGQNSSMNVVQATNIALYEITKQFM